MKKEMISLTEDLLLVLAMITDTFFMSLTYSASKIRIPVVSVLIISFVSTAFLAVSLLVSEAIAAFIPTEYCRITGALILGIIGIVQFSQNSLKAILRKHSGNGRVSFSCFNIGFVISVYLDETRADSDFSKVLSAKESFALSLALSVDSLCGGLAAGISGSNIIRVGVMSFLLGVLSVSAGEKIGRQVNNKKFELSWLSGVFLICLAIIRLF